MGRLSGRTAVVTGGAKRIGRYYSQALAAEVAEVVIVDIADGEYLAQELVAKFGPNAGMSVTCNVSNEAAVQRLIERFSKIDVLVNNAALIATLPEQNVTEIDVDTCDRVMAVNLRGSFVMVQHAAVHMIVRRYGKIINIGSGTAAPSPAASRPPSGLTCLATQRPEAVRH